jgi:aminopeptidase N
LLPQEAFSMSEKIFLKDYRKPSYQILTTNLHLNLDPDLTTVSSKLKIKKDFSGPLVLDGVDLQLLSIELNGRKLSANEFLLEKETLTLPEPHESEFELAVLVSLCPSKNTSLEGLYLSNDILCTQCEAQGFRKITYFIDRPDVMSQFSVSIEADIKKYPILLSNGNRLQSFKVSSTRHRAEYFDPSKKPCYLFALVAGDLGLLKDQFTTLSGKVVDLEIYSRHGTQDQCRHALQALKDSMSWDEKRYQLEYDLSNYMIVAVDDFNAGAMENKGLNIFNSKLVFADESLATDDDYFHIESVVAHEYFHNWTGNRVTLRDWFQLSLKEGLTVFRDQEFSGDQTDLSLQRLRDVESLWKRQFPEDNGPSAHPVRPDSCMAVDNFFTPTIYEKGAEIIRLIQTLLGRPLFAEGLKNYLLKNDGKAATIEDFIQAFEEVSGQDLSGLMSWYTQAGTPTLHVSENYDQQTQKYSIHLEQKLIHGGEERIFTPYFYPLTVLFFDADGKKMNLKHSSLISNSEKEILILIKDKTHTLTFESVQTKPIASWLRNYSAPIFIQDEKSNHDLLVLFRFENDFFKKRQLFQNFLINYVSSLLLTKPPQDALKDSHFLSFTKCVEHLLSSDSLSMAQKSMLIFPLEDQMFLIKIPGVSLPRLKMAIRQAYQTIAENISQSLLKILESKAHDLSKSEAKAFRAFQSSAWFYLNLNPSQDFKKQVLELFLKSSNMTTVEATYKVMLNWPQNEREFAISNFFDRYSENQLTLNKWFSAIALCDHSQTFHSVQKLIQHKSYNSKNPNNVYALLRSFGQNIFCFHTESGLAYDFYLEQIKQIDQVNPQVAARLCAAFQTTSQLEESQKLTLHKKMSRFLHENTLSKNTLELLKNYESCRQQ